MKKYTLALTALFFISPPVFAESMTEICATEAQDAGIDDTAEFNRYVNECVEQMNTAAQNEQEEQEEPTGEHSELEPEVAQTN